ncbi:hypothetical protein ColTof4_00667 [Colletotrichum tofieldiae]|nr:hypothetical protein ColTof3_07878 [Colletotrichum tofieldiae]GKT68244.1 hypothetical protein ColTof4_00667 [Colletotrichum tofieldiae]GKT90749.1 hypothetical protein Ct61P_08599 [Colletotrichum tofieldiae]
MPSLRAQANTSRQPSSYTTEDSVKRAMMDDLGTIRIDELPLDDTPNPRAIPPRPRRTPIITEKSEALNGYLAMAEKGIDDAEAMAVRDLHDLGGPSIYRPTAGPTKSFVAENRPPPSSFHGMQTSQHGILLPPGAVVHRFTSSKGVSENAPADSKNPGVVTGPQSGNATAADASKKHLPPHLRMKKKTETPLSDQPSSGNEASTEVSKPTTTNDSAVSQAKEKMIPLHTLAASDELPQCQGAVNESQKGQYTAPHPNTVKHDHTSEQDVSEDEVVIYWAGSCKTWVPEQGKDCMVMIDLKIINTAENIEGQSLFVMTLPEVFVKRHSMRSYLLEFQKTHNCVIKFINPDTGLHEGRYSLKFEDMSTATEFQHRAALLQKVMGFLSDVAAANNETIVEAGHAPEKTTAQEQSHRPEASVTEPPVKDSMDIPQAKNESKTMIEESKPSAKTEANAPKESKDTTDIMTDAFNNLSLNKVKGADMYKANRQRVQYSAEELLERRSSAEAPSGITEVKIPLNRKIKQPTNPPSTQDSLKGNYQVVKLPSNHDSAKLKDWVAGKKIHSKTEGAFQISMPGLSEAVRYQKAIAITAESSAQARKEPSSENKLDKVIADKKENDIDDSRSENGAGNAEVNVGTEKMDMTKIDADLTASKSKDANTKVGPEVAIVKATPAGESAISVQSNKSDDGAAGSSASNDSAVGFQPSSKNERPSTIAIDQNDQKTICDTVPPSDMTLPAPAPATVADKQDGVAKQAPAVVVKASTQSVPMMAPITTPAAPFAVHPNPRYGFHGYNGQAMSPPTSMTQLASPQMSSPLVATPPTTQPYVTYTPQMQAHSIIPGLQQYPPAGIVHAMTVTYHISHPGPSDGPILNPGQGHMPAIRHVTDFNGRALSPGAQVFHPQFQGQVPQRNPSQNRMRRGLESSIFATGHSGAKHAGSFTGASSE